MLLFLEGRGKGGREREEGATRGAYGSVSSKRGWFLDGRFLLEYMHSALLKFAGSFDVSIALDAARIGNPSSETLLLVGWAGSLDRAVVLPPQVTIWILFLVNS